jgi:hypothetical protein
MNREEVRRRAAKRKDADNLKRTLLFIFIAPGPD